MVVTLKSKVGQQEIHKEFNSAVYQHCIIQNNPHRVTLILNIVACTRRCRYPEFAYVFYYQLQWMALLIGTMFTLRDLSKYLLSNCPLETFDERSRLGSSYS